MTTSTRAKVLYSFTSGVAHANYVCDTVGNVYSLRNKKRIPKPLQLIKGPKRDFFKLNGVIEGHNCLDRGTISKLRYQHQKTPEAFVLVNNSKMSRTAFDKLKISDEPVAVVTNDVKPVDLPIAQPTAQMTLLPLTLPQLIAQQSTAAPKPTFQVQYVGKTGQNHTMVANGKTVTFDDEQEAINKAIAASKQNPDTPMYMVTRVVAIIKPKREVAVEIIK